MSQPAENLRVRRTRRLLREALVDLTEDRGFDRLTVGEITERAMVSRSAFYRTYRDKYQLAEQVFDEAMAELLGAVGDGGGARPPAERWEAFFEHLDAYHRFYGVLLGRRGGDWFAARMRTSLTAMVEEHLPKAASGPAGAAGADGLAATVLGAMLTQSITWWLENGRPCAPREIALRSGQLAGAVITVAGGWAEPPLVRD